MNHPHWYYHYLAQGRILTACDRPYLNVMHHTPELEKVNCRWCLRSNEVLAQRMEDSLLSNPEDPACPMPSA